jgi:hypothetical protein
MRITVACLGSGLKFLVGHGSQPGGATHAQFGLEKILAEKIGAVLLRGWMVARGGIRN